MTPDDELERELESFRPRPPSPELRRRIGRRLDGRWRLRVPMAIAAASAAAAIIIAVVYHRPAPTPVDRSPAIATVRAPSVLAYERAFARSPADLDALLDEQAVRSSGSIASTQTGAAQGILALKGS